ncbi:MAG: plasmid pRiA4b ORF-3 family protein [Chloroflexi bacterium]|nr:plasmid pRiA4b ORF-3 family protein [Chloroflexota bacterium]
MPAKQTAPAEIARLKVTLRGSKPPIWRRIEAPSNIRLDKLHDVLQIIMGWKYAHLHQFIVNAHDRTNTVFYGAIDSDMGFNQFDDLNMRNESKARLNEILTAPKSRIIYEYDFGDSWEHDIVLEKLLPPEPGVKYPRCIAGKRNGPPEDVGGIWGYAHLLDAITHPASSDDRELIEWVGGDFDPEAFDLEAINARLRRIRLS